MELEPNLLNGIKVLVVDDWADSQLLTKIYLKKCGATTDGADNGREACEKAAANSYDVILMDIQMPELDGYETTKLLRSRGDKTPIIALTAHAMESARMQSMEVGCNAHVTKPINLSELARKIHELTT